MYHLFESDYVTNAHQMFQKKCENLTLESLTLLTKNKFQ